jgi:CRP-like cAMP-binding protein
MSSLKDHGNLFNNQLLAALPREEYERLSPHLELVRLTLGKILYNAGDPVRYAYFPKGGMVCLLSTTESGKTMEVGMIGSEGMVGLPIVLRCGVTSYRVMVQITTNALRIRGDALRREFDRGGRLQDLLLRYTHTLLVQVSQSATCNRFHTVEERLCRWLLVGRDCVQTDTISLTQEFLSEMLGVPRTSITAIAGTLQKEGLIRYGRGKIVILNRAGMESRACECYRLVRNGVREFFAA